jgi:hypothetical protein
MDFTPVLTYISLAGAAYSAFTSHFVSRREAQRDQDIALLKKQADLFWRMVEQHMTTVLHSPHTPDLDKLLERLQEGDKLTEEEADELSKRLLEIINNPDEQQGNRSGAIFLLAAIERRRNVNPNMGE